MCDQMEPPYVGCYNKYEVRCKKGIASKSRKQLADDGADGFAFGAASGFGLDRFDDGTHFFFARCTDFLNRGSDQLFEFFRRKRFGEESFENGNFFFLFVGEFGPATFFELFDGIAALFDLPLNDGDEIGFRKMIGFLFDLDVTDGGLEHA